MAGRRDRKYWPRLIARSSALVLVALTPLVARAQQSSISTWDAADFRIWGYIPYWATTSQINGFATNGMYTHVSDVLYFGGLRPDPTGNLTWASSSYQTQFNTIRSQSATNGFKMHLSMFEVTNGQTDATWESIVANSTYRQNFVTQLKNVMLGSAGTADDLKGFNFDWERPNTATEWGNYTQLARELGNAIHPLGMEVSVCDYGYPDTTWDDTSLFDANVYDQLFIMGYLYTASQNNTYANLHNGLTGQGTAKAFKDSQIAIGVGTYTQGASTTGLSTIVAANPNLAYDAGSYTGTIGGTTGTWTFESRKQVREKTDVALGRNMSGMFSWTLHYDATNNLGLHRVMHHYVVVKRDIPDLDLNGKVDATDANTLANNMGAALTNTGMSTAAQMDAFYLAGNWEKGDHDGNGFVNQADADWLAARYTTLGVSIPDRLAYSGTFESFSNSMGSSGRWSAGRDRQGKLVETGNFKQEVANFLSWSGTGTGAPRHSNSFVTMRNQNSAETTAGINSLSRTMRATLATNIDLGQQSDTYVTFLVRENTAALSPAQMASSNRTLTLDFLSASGASQFDFSLHGLQHQFGIDSVADAAGQDVSADGFSADNTYLFVGKISANGAAAHTLQASLFASGAVVADFTNPEFQWMLTANGGDAFNPVITNLQFTSNSAANYTVSNVWIGNAAAILPPTLTSQGDFNHDGIVDSRDYVLWRKTMGQTGANLVSDGDGNYQVDSGDLGVWRAHFGQSVSGAGAELLSASIPEPAGWAMILAGVVLNAFALRR